MNIKKDAKAQAEKRARREAEHRSRPRSAPWYRERQSHISPRQRALIREHFPRFGIKLSYGEPLDPQLVFSLPEAKAEAKARVILDIGFGTGDSLLHLAQTRTDCAIIGVEMLSAGVAQTLDKLYTGGHINTKVIKADVKLLLQQNLVDDSVDEAYVLFPDPWTNAARDAEKRVIRHEILALLERKLRQGSLLRVATDVEEMAVWTEQVMADRPNGLWALKSKKIGSPGDGPSYRAVTKYELRAAELNHHNVYDLEYTLMARNNNSM